MKMKTAAPLLATLFLFCIPLLTIGQFRKVYVDSDPDNVVSGIHFLSEKEGFVSFVRSIGYSADSGRSFTKRQVTFNNVNYGNHTNIILTGGFRVNGVHAFDKNNLILYGHYWCVPAILTSSDGGNSFELVFHDYHEYIFGDEGITDMVFPDNPDIGYAISKNRVLKTINGGKSWNIRYQKNGANFSRLSFLSSNAGFIADDKNELLYTGNGGAEWSVTKVPQGRFFSLSFLNEHKGWINVEQKVYQTVDAGASWTLITDEFQKVPPTIRFTSDNLGYAVGDGFDVQKTTDGGKFWEPVKRDNDFSYLGYSHYELFILNTTTMWAGGGHGFVELNTNAGSATLPVAKFTTDLSELATSGLVKLHNFSKPGDEYHWFKNNVFFSSSFNTSYSSNRLSIDTIKLVVKRGADSDSLQRIVDTRANSRWCEATFSTLVDTGTVTFTPAYDAPGVKHYWSFGDGYSDSMNAKASHLYERVGTYRVKHTVYNTIDKCTAVTEQDVVVERITRCLSVDFTYEADSFFTNKLKFSFTCDKTKDSKCGYQFVGADWGDGSTSENTSAHEFPESKVYNVCFTISNFYASCTSTVCKPVKVELPDKCDASFKMSKMDAQIKAEAKRHVNNDSKKHTWIINGWDITNTGSALNFEKEVFPIIRDGESEYAFTPRNCRVYRKIGLDSLNISITHIVRDIKTSESDTVTHKYRYTQKEELILKLNPYPIFPLASAIDLYYLNPAKDTVKAITDMYFYKFYGPGQNMHGNLSFLNFSEPGRYEVGVYTLTNCIDNYIGSEAGEYYYRFVDVAPTDCPIYPPGFITRNSPNGVEVSFTDTTQGINGWLGNKFVWSFGDGDTSTLVNPVHEYKTPGTYTATLRYTNINGCSKEFKRQVITESKCNISARFMVQRDAVVPARISFVNQTISGNPVKSYKWYFGATDSSTLENPTFLFKQPGSYLVKLVSYDELLCESIYDTTIVITAKDICDLQPKFFYALQDAQVQFFNHTTPVGNYKQLWSFGDQVASTENEPAHTYTQNGAYVVCLKVVRDSLCAAEVCDSVQYFVERKTNVAVYPNPAGSVLDVKFVSNESGPVTLTITNMFGREMYKEQKQSSIGVNSYTIGIVQLPPGTYNLKITGLSHRVIRRFVKM